MRSRQNRGKRMSPIQQSAVRNDLLAALPPDDFARLVPSLQPVRLDLKQVLHEPERPIEAAYFPESGMVSLVARLEDGAAQEVGIVGREGVVGLAVALGAESVGTEALVQADGAALRIDVDELRAAFERSAALRALLLRYAQALHAQVSQTAACNGRHVVDERLARWLLMAHDRADGDEFPMTQEFMAMMLGVRRAGVSVAAGVLQKAGVIGHAYGRMTVLDRAGLEAASCECYGAVRRQFERLLGLPAGE
jgi:CRP-like cAMP-binding protein